MYWNFIGDVGVDIGMMLISDANNFSKINEKFQYDWEEEIIENEFSSYFVPWLGGDGDWNLFGINVDKKTSEHNNERVVNQYINTKYPIYKTSLNFGNNNSDDELEDDVLPSKNKPRAKTRKPNESKSKIFKFFINIIC